MAFKWIVRGYNIMARKSNPFSADDSITATKAQLSALSKYALDIFNAKLPDLHNPDEVTDAITGYFQSCADNGVRPSNLGLYAVLGMSRQDMDDVLRGKNKSKVNPACIDILKRAKRALSSYREGLAVSGLLNPATAIFWAKNFDSMADVTTIEVTSERNDAPQLTQEDIAKRIPVYSDIEQDET